jgi:hypothetical protein
LIAAFNENKTSTCETCKLNHPVKVGAVRELSVDDNTELQTELG